MSRAAKRRLGLALEIGVPLLVVLAWWVWSAGSANLYYPPLSDILTAFKNVWLFDRVGSDVVPSLARLLSGYAIAVLLGVGVGVALGLSRPARRAATPLVDFLRAIPPPALIPLGIVVLGVGNTSKIAIIAFVCVWPILLNAIDGAASVEPVRLETARVFGLGRWEKIRTIVLPSAAPRIFAGMRTSLAAALILMVISEMVSSTNGIGFFVLSAQRTFALTDMWAGILLLGLLGYLLNLALSLLERRVLSWYRGERASARDAS
jgi:ABC-type nitrate/sulfonate/bicarbonate transport system permease component